MTIQQQQSHGFSIPPSLLITDGDAGELSGEIGSSPGVSTVRLRSLDERGLQFEIPAQRDRYVIGIVLRRTGIRIVTSDSTIYTGFALPGQVYVTGPNVSTGYLFEGPYDVLHLHISSALVAESIQAVSDHPRMSGMETGTFQDCVIERLALTLVTSGQMLGRCDRIYADCIGRAIVTRILASQSKVATTTARYPAGLVKWRLKRALDYIEANLANQVNLTGMANASGLTRMHFAAQFKISTGLRPREFVMRRRIERAQEMLLAPKVSLVDVAMEVGFHSQSHFTSVFKRFVGKPPHAWRECEERAA